MRSCDTWVHFLLGFNVAHFCCLMDICVSVFFSFTCLAYITFSLELILPDFFEEHTERSLGTAALVMCLKVVSCIGFCVYIKCSNHSSCKNGWSPF